MHPEEHTKKKGKVVEDKQHEHSVLAFDKSEGRKLKLC
jgi:hypothetical protein